MTDRNDNTCYIERSKVREIVIGHNAATQAVLSKIDALQIFVAEDFRAQPRLLSGCLRDGTCRGLCRNEHCPNYDMVVAARVCVVPKEDGVVYPE